MKTAKSSYETVLAAYDAIQADFSSKMKAVTTPESTTTRAGNDAWNQNFMQFQAEKAEQERKMFADNGWTERGFWASNTRRHNKTSK